MPHNLIPNDRNDVAGMVLHMFSVHGQPHQCSHCVETIWNQKNFKFVKKRQRLQGLKCPNVESVLSA